MVDQLCSGNGIGTGHSGDEHRPCSDEAPTSSAHIRLDTAQIERCPAELLKESLANLENITRWTDLPRKVALGEPGPGSSPFGE